MFKCWIISTVFLAHTLWRLHRVCPPCTSAFSRHTWVYILASAALSPYLFLNPKGRKKCERAKADLVSTTISFCLLSKQNFVGENGSLIKLLKESFIQNCSASESFRNMEWGPRKIPAWPRASQYSFLFYPSDIKGQKQYQPWWKLGFQRS